MRRIAILSFAFLTFVVICVTRADGAQEGDVEVMATADRDQPTGWPVLLELTVTNTGSTSVTWWCGGPELYPGAEHFDVEVRYGGEDQWHSVVATNGQYQHGSGFSRELKPGKSIVVPLAIPVEKAWITFKITPRKWRTTAAAVGHIELRKDRKYADERRARVIASAMAQSPPFWQHLAEDYADGVVVDAMLKLVTVDNAPIVSGAARTLARQKTLPKSEGDSFALLINRWLPRKLSMEWGGLQVSIAQAALKTESESARSAMLKLMAETKDARTRSVAIDALRISPGDQSWLRRAREAIAALRPLGAKDDLAREQTMGTDWLDSRIKYPQ